MLLDLRKEISLSKKTFSLDRSPLDIPWLYEVMQQNGVRVFFRGKNMEINCSTHLYGNRNSSHFLWKGRKTFFKNQGCWWLQRNKKFCFWSFSLLSISYFKSFFSSPFFPDAIPFLVSQLSREKPTWNFFQTFEAEVMTFPTRPPVFSIIPVELNWHQEN